MSRTAAMLAAVVLAAIAPEDAGSQPLKAAVFDFELINTSTPLVPPTEAERGRLAMLSDRLRDALGASARYDVVDIAPVRAEAARSRLRACGGCDRRFAEAVGADVSLTGVIHKVSELILNISIFERDTRSGKIVRAVNADIRSNTDQSWTRGLDFLLKHRILTEATAQ